MFLSNWNFAGLDCHTEVHTEVKSFNLCKVPLWISVSMETVRIILTLITNLSQIVQAYICTAFPLGKLEIFITWDP